MAARALWHGGVVAHAAEGVWGLACDPWCARAVVRILRMKRRAPGKGLILVAADADQLSTWLDPLQADMRAMILDSWPGPHTWIVPDDQHRAPPWISGGRRSIALRVPARAQLRSLCAVFGAPLVSTSANIGGRSAARSHLAVRLLFGDRLDAILPYGGPLSGQASSVREVLTGKTIR